MVLLKGPGMTLKEGITQKQFVLSASVVCNLSDLMCPSAPTAVRLVSLQLSLLLVQQHYQQQYICAILFDTP